MALRAVTEHPKFFHLKSILGVGKLVAVGALETMWHFCGKFTPQGGLGKYSVSQIEAWCEWDGSPGALVSALVEAGWLDRHPTYGLLVHDWHRHCDDATKLANKRAGVDFVTYRNADGTYPVGNAQKTPNQGASSGQSAHPVETLSGQSGDGVATVSGLPGAGAEPVPEPGPVPAARDAKWRERIDGQWILLEGLLGSEIVVDALEEFAEHRAKIGAGGYDASRIEALASFASECKPTPGEFADFVRHCFRDKGWKTLPPDLLPKWLAKVRGGCNPGDNPGPRPKPRSQWTPEERAAHEAELDRIEAEVGR